MRNAKYTGSHLVTGTDRWGHGPGQLPRRQRPVNNTNWPYGHVGLAGGSTPAGRRSRRRRFKARESEIFVPFEPAVDREATGSVVYAKGPPELAPAMSSVVVCSGEDSNLMLRLMKTPK